MQRDVEPFSEENLTLYLDLLFFLQYSIVVLTREHLPQHSCFSSYIVSPSPLPLWLVCLLSVLEFHDGGFGVVARLSSGDSAVVIFSTCHVYVLPVAKKSSPVNN